MNSLKLLLLFILLSFGVNGQSDSLGPNEYLYDFDIKYYGSEAGVDPNYQYILDSLVNYINKNDSLHLHVRGHVCCGPSKRLSKRRARKMYRYLIRAGINKRQVSFKGYSDTRPKRWPEKTEEDEIENRRVDFVIRKE